MRKLAAILVVAWLAGPTLADDMTPVSNDRTSSGKVGGTHDGMASAEHGGKRFCAKSAEKILGAKVEDASGKDIGTIEDLAIDPANGRVVYGVLATGGFLGIGNKSFAVPLCSFKCQGNGKYTLNFEKSRFENADGFDRSHWPMVADAQWLMREDQYGSRSMATDTDDSMRQTAMQQPQPNYTYSHSGTDVGEALASRPAGISSDSGNVVAQQPAGITVPSGAGYSNAAVATTPAYGRPYRDVNEQTGGVRIARTASYGSSPNSPSDFSENMMPAAQLIRAHDLIGEPIQDAQGEALGRVKGLSIDTRNSRVSCAVLSCGGVLGVGEKLHAVPWQKISVLTDANDKDEPLKIEKLTANVTKDSLTSAPTFTASNWPAENEPSYYVTVYRFYAVPVYWEQ